MDNMKDYRNIGEGGKELEFGAFSHPFNASDSGTSLCGELRPTRVH